MSVAASALALPPDKIPAVLQLCKHHPDGLLRYFELADELARASNAFKANVPPELTDSVLQIRPYGSEVRNYILQGAQEFLTAGQLGKNIRASRPWHR